MLRTLFQKQRIVPRHLQLAIRNDEEWVAVSRCRDDRTHPFTD